MDLFRTLTLMSMQGLRPGNNKSEYLMRKMVNDNMGKMGDSSDLIDYYYNQWSKLIDPLIGKEEVKIILQEESNRAKNRALMKQFGINPSKQNLDVLYEQNLREFLLKKDWQDLKDNFK